MGFKSHFHFASSLAARPSYSSGSDTRGKPASADQLASASPGTNHLIQETAMIPGRLAKTAKKQTSMAKTFMNVRKVQLGTEWAGGRALRRR